MGQQNCLRFQHGLAFGLWSKNCPYNIYIYIYRCVNIFLEKYLRVYIYKKIIYIQYTHFFKECAQIQWKKKSAQIYLVKAHNFLKVGNYSKPTCDLTRIHITYLWFEKCHFTYLRFVSFVYHNPPILKTRINMYFCSPFMSLFSQN